VAQPLQGPLIGWYQ